MSSTVRAEAAGDDDQVGSAEGDLDGGAACGAALSPTVVWKKTLMPRSRSCRAM